MNLDTFVLWKFKRFEGRLKGFHSADMYTTKIEHGLDQYELSYDIKVNRAKLVNSFNGKEIFDCSFKELENYLDGLGLLVERQDNRHSSADVPMQFDL